MIERYLKRKTHWLAWAYGVANANDTRIRGVTMKFQANQKLLMIGDSVTDAGRERPAGEGLFDALGKGYVAQVNALIGVSHPELGLRIVNMGNSGNTVRDLKNRWRADVLHHKPDWVSICIGVNDVWRQFDSPWQKEWHVLEEEYRETLENLVVETAPLVKGIILMTPFYIEPNKSDPMRAKMDVYGAIVREISANCNTEFVDVQAAFDEILNSYYPATLSWDRVHPNQIGTMAIARAFLKEMNFVW